jgi:hypothetical protein
MVAILTSFPGKPKSMPLLSWFNRDVEQSNAKPDTQAAAMKTSAMKSAMERVLVKKKLGTTR